MEVTTILLIIFSPLIIAAYLVFILIWICLTISGVGPLLQYYFNSKDHELLSDHNTLGSHADMKKISLCGTHTLLIFNISQSHL